MSSSQQAASQVNPQMVRAAITIRSLQARDSRGGGGQDEEEKEESRRGRRGRHERRRRRRMTEETGQGQNSN
eukprot:552196-Hanusia_phi.AAC.1